ncbi:MAG: glycosyltransferase family 2 protein [Syntrophales bacterium]
MEEKKRIKRPLVSVIICVYNAGLFLREALTSVINQTYRELEIVIIDDGSTDECMETIADIDDPRIIIVRQQNQGKPAALNHALGIIKGEFYTQQDADDASYPQRIEKQIECMTKYPELAAVYTGHDMIVGTDRRVAPCYQSYGTEEACDRVRELKVVALDPTGLFRVDMVKSILYDVAFSASAEGMDYMFRVGERFPIMVLGECLYSYRIRWDSLTRKRDPLLRMQKVWDAKRDACNRMGLNLAKYIGSRPDVGMKLSSRHYDNDLASDFIVSVKSCIKNDMRFKAIEAGIICASMNPLDGHYLKALIYALCPAWIIKRR